MVAVQTMQPWALQIIYFHTQKPYPGRHTSVSQKWNYNAPKQS